MNILLNKTTITLCLWFFTGLSYASSICEQSYVFIGAVKGDPDSVWIIEETSGMCVEAELTQIPIKKIERVRTVYLNEENQFSKLTNIFTGLKLYKHTKLSNNQKDKVTGIRVSAPGRLKKNWDSIASIKDWNKTDKAERFRLPVITGISNTELIFYDPDGLYVNYGIRDVYVINDLDILVIFTTQEERTSRNDTMNGYLIVKYKN